MGLLSLSFSHVSGDYFTISVCIHTHTCPKGPPHTHTDLICPSSEWQQREEMSGALESNQPGFESWLCHFHPLISQRGDGDTFLQPREAACIKRDHPGPRELLKKCELYSVALQDQRRSGLCLHTDAHPLFMQLQDPM